MDATIFGSTSTFVVGKDEHLSSRYKPARDLSHNNAKQVCLLPTPAICMYDPRKNIFQGVCAISGKL